MPVYEAIGHFISKNQAASVKSSSLIKPEEISFGNFRSFLKLPDTIEDKEFREILHWHANMWLDHRFDLLGSGWVSRNKGTEPVGYMGFTVPFQKSDTTSDLDDKAIDWQLDIKSGFRWDEKLSSSAQTGFLQTPYGVDVKVPWELARMNHLPLLVIAGKIFPELQKRISEEFIDILNDFFEHNPFMHGINWSNAMEVSIRLVNILLATDFMIQWQSDNSFKDEFIAQWEEAIFQHLKFILEHSEFKNGLTNNHYYSNISALLFAGSFFAETSSGKNLLNLGFEEVVVETDKQFLADGGNFESSTHYHRLSTEMLLWNILVLDQNSNSIEPKKATLFRWNNFKNYTGESTENKLSKLKRIASRALHFSKAISKANGNITSCGDQDSGRYIKLSFAGEFKCFEELKHVHKQIELGNYNEDPKAIWWVENDLDHRYLHSMQKMKSKNGSYPLEFHCFTSLKIPDTTVHDNVVMEKTSSAEFKYSKKSVIPFGKKTEIDPNSIEWAMFDSFGIYIAKADSFFLSVMATNNHLPRYWSHGKNDKLSFELQIDGKDLILDPGSFIYSADVEMRNHFRSTRSHSSIQINDLEQNRWPDGKISVFNLYNESKCRLISASKKEITLLCSYRNIRHLRTFRIHSDHLEIFDQCNREFRVNFNRGELHSNHYGRWINSEKESSS
jgi:hypothetical protein